MNEVKNKNAKENNEEKSLKFHLKIYVQLFHKIMIMTGATFKYSFLF